MADLLAAIIIVAVTLHIVWAASRIPTVQQWMIDMGEWLLARRKR